MAELAYRVTLNADRRAGEDKKFPLSPPPARHGTYITSPFYRLCPIPDEAAIAWVKQTCPDLNMGLGCLAKDMVSRRDWLNKFWVVVGEVRGGELALYHHDGVIYIYVTA